MASNFVGAVIGVNTRTPYAVINTDDDGELDNPKYLLPAIPRFEPLRMLRIPRNSYEASVKTPHDLVHMIDLMLRLERQ